MSYALRWQGREKSQGTSSFISVTVQQMILKRGHMMKFPSQFSSGKVLSLTVVCSFLRRYNQHGRVLFVYRRAQRRKRRNWHRNFNQGLLLLCFSSAIFVLFQGFDPVMCLDISLWGERFGSI